MTWPFLLEVLKWSWGPISGIATFLVVQHFWPTYKKWASLKENISTIYTQYGNLRPKLRYEQETPEFGESPTGQKIVGPTVITSYVANETQMDGAIQTLRKLAGSVRALRDSTLGYGLLAFIRVVPNAQTIKELSGQLIGWSNEFDVEKVDERSLEKRRQVIKKLLNLIDE